MAADLIEQPLFCGQDRHQLTATHVAADQHRLIAVVGVLRRHQVHHHIGVSALDQAVVDLLGEGVVVAVVLKADLDAAQHVIKDDPVQGLDDHRVGHLGALDFLLHVLLLVGEELVDLTAALQVALALQIDQGRLHRLLMGPDIEVGLLDQQDRDVACRALELRHPLEQKQRLEDAQLQRPHLVLGRHHRLLFVGPDHIADAVIELVKAGQTPHRQFLDRLGHLLEHREHRALAHGHVAPLEDAVGCQALDRLLEQAQLIGVERIQPAEALAVTPALELNRAIAEAIEGGEVLLLLLVNIDKLLRFIRCLGQQAPLDHLLHIGAGQGELGLEAALNLAQVVRLLKLHLADYSFEVGLGGNEYGRPTICSDSKTLHNSLQIEQTRSFFSDELACLVYEEIEPESRRLAIEVLLDPASQAFNREAVAVLSVINNFDCIIFAATELLGIGFCKAAFGYCCNCIAVVLPAAAVHSLVGLLEHFELAALVEVVLELGHIALVAVVALQLVEHFHEHFEDRCLVGAANTIKFLCNIE